VSFDADYPEPLTREALDELFSVAYEELRRLAARVRGTGDDDTLSPTALVNEAYLKLAQSLRLTPASRRHIKRIVARAKRQVLIEAARRKQAHKRGGGSPIVTFDEGLAAGLSTSEDVLALDAALEDLARAEPRQAAMVECRFFGGFDVAETAQLLAVSEATVLRDWRAARAWLGHQLRLQ
jgi:RNA polymerase sigma factor (TIGR02999 family)